MGKDLLLSRVRLKRVPETPLFVAKYPTGLDDKLQEPENTVHTVLWKQGAGAEGANQGCVN